MQRKNSLHMHLKLVSSLFIVYNHNFSTLSTAWFLILFFIAWQFIHSMQLLKLLTILLIQYDYLRHLQYWDVRNLQLRFRLPVLCLGREKDPGCAWLATWPLRIWVLKNLLGGEGWQSVLIVAVCNFVGLKTSSSR